MVVCVQPSSESTVPVAHQPRIDSLQVTAVNFPICWGNSHPRATTQRAGSHGVATYREVALVTATANMLALTKALTLASLVNTQWDYYKFAQFHDGSRYTIHGLWPSRDDHTWPEFCPGPRFNETALLPLEPRLEKDWPNYFGSSLALHKHEYLRHGRCTGLSEVDYFSATLDAYERYNLNNLVPESTEPPFAAELEERFYSKYGVVLTVDHWRHGRAREVSFCLDKVWNLMDCPENLSRAVV